MKPRRLTDEVRVLIHTLGEAVLTEVAQDLKVIICCRSIRLHVVQLRLAVSIWPSMSKKGRQD